MGRGIDDVQRIAAFRFALRRFERTTELAAQSAGLTARQYILLLAIAGVPNGGGRATIGALADRLQLAQSTITGLVDRAGRPGRARAGRARRPRRLRRRHVLGRTRLQRAIDALDADREALAEAAAALRPHLPARRRGRLNNGVVSAGAG